MSEQNLFSLDLLNQQETLTKAATYQKVRGWCDFASSAMDVLLKLLHFTDEFDVNTQEGEYKSYCWFHFERIAYTFKAAYNLCLTGYYPEASILLRTIMETFVKTKYLQNHKDLLQGAWGLDRFPVRYKDMFDEVAPGCYEDYSLLCEFAHGYGIGILSRFRGMRPPILRHGVEYSEDDASFVMNRFGPYLLAYLHFIVQVFPEIRQNLDPQLLLAYQTSIQQLTHHLVGLKPNWQRMVCELIG